MLIALLALATPAHAESHLTLGAKFGAAFAPDYVRTAYSPAVSLGARWDSGIQLGMRVVILPFPPEVYGEDTPELAIGPVVDFTYNFAAGQQFEFYPTVSLGVAIGKSPRDGTNQIMPQFATGFGAHYLVASGEDNQIYIGPEFGFVPLVLAPYMAVNAGVNF